MNIGGLKTTIWYKCLFCHSCFQSPNALVVHRMKSKCRFQYKEIHKQRSKWPFETPLLENLDRDEASRLKNSQQLLKSYKTRQYSNETKKSVPELTEKSINLDLNQVTSCNVDPLPRNQEQSKYNCHFCSSLFTNFEDLKNHMKDHTREESDENKSGSFNFDNCEKFDKSSTSGEFICMQCPKSYTQSIKLRIHVFIVHEKRILNVPEHLVQVDI